ncbi:MAG: 2OG-Fe(II) oxygenase [Pseudomonadota bacterium]
MRDILDLDRYPLDAPGTPAAEALVANCTASLASRGMFNLDDLVRPEVTAALATEIGTRVFAEGYEHRRRHNIYFDDSIALDPAHPARKQVETSNHTLCADQLARSALDRIYRYPALIDFVAATLGKPVLHPMADPLAAVNVMGYREGEALNWHFDRSEFTITLLLQAPDHGGEFEYRQHARSDTDPNYEGVARLLRGEDDAVDRVRLTPGTLNVFKGRNTAHRVTPVGGSTPRLIAVFSYFDRPGVHFSAAEQRGFYGREKATPDTRARRSS